MSQVGQITPEFLKKHAKPLREASYCTQYDIFIWPVAKDKAAEAKRKAAPLDVRISNLKAQMNNYSHKVGACTGDKVPSIQGGVWDKLHRGKLMMEVDEEGHSVEAFCKKVQKNLVEFYIVDTTRKKKDPPSEKSSKYCQFGNCDEGSL
jgi:hypothetical protein